MRLKQIKQVKDDGYIIQERKLLKELLHLDENVQLFYLGYFFGRDFFLYKKQILISSFEIQNDECDYVLKTMKITECYSVTLLKEYPQNINDIEFKILFKPKREIYAIDGFFEWIDRPCNITEAIDLPFYRIIKFLQGYEVTLFKSENYLFYTKQDDDLSCVLNIYAQNLKTQKEIKLYFPNKYGRGINLSCDFSSPQNLQDIVVDV